MVLTCYTILFDLFILSFAGITVLGAFCYLFGGSFFTLIVSSSIVLPVLLYIFLKFSDYCVTRKKLSRSETILLTFFLVSSLVVTLLLDKPDADDEFYLGVSVLLLQNAHNALNALPFNLGGYSFSIHEHLKAALTYLTPLPILYSYYLVVPLFLASLATFIHARILKLFIPKGWVIGMFFFFIVMLAWGDVHRTHANFGFVRMFQGKAGLVSIIVPAILYYYLRYKECGKKTDFILLHAAVIGGIGFSPTGFIIGPLLYGLLFLPNLDFRGPKRKTNIYVIITLSILLIALWYVIRLKFGRYYNLVHTSHGLVEHTTNLEMYKFVMGEGFRGVFALACFVISPLFIVPKSIRVTYRNFMIACITLLMIPNTSEIIAKNTLYTVSWRWFWIIPFPLTMCIVTGGIYIKLKKLNKPKSAALLLVGIIALFILSSNKFVLSKKYNSNTCLTTRIFKLPANNRIRLRPLKLNGIYNNGKLCIENTSTCY